jgi:hypothetical protein
VGDGSSGEREVKGEGGKGSRSLEAPGIPIYSHHRGGRAKLGEGWCDVALPVPAGEHRAATLTPVGVSQRRAEVTRGDPPHLCHTQVLPRAPTWRCCLAFIFGPIKLLTNLELEVLIWLGR